jgi:TraK protein
MIMKKTTLAVALLSCISVFGVANAQTKQQAPITVDRTLKDQDREAYDALKKSGGKSGVMTSTVTVSDGSGESVIENTISKPSAKQSGKETVLIPAGSNSATSTGQGVAFTPAVVSNAGAGRGVAQADPQIASGKGGVGQAAKGLTAPDTTKSKPVAKVQPNEMKVVKSETAPGMDSKDAMDAMDSMAKQNTKAAGQQSREQMSKQAALDKVMPEAGVRMVEKTTRKEVIEKMVPPSDEMIYGALKQQGQSETRSRVGSSSGGASDEAIVIEAIQGVNEIVTIGKSDLNRFVTPFEKIKVRTSASEEELVSVVDGNIVYLGATKRSGVFITEVGSDRAISLTLVPDDVPPRDIYIKLSRSGNIPSGLTKTSKTTGKGGVGGISSTDSATGKSQSHVDFVKDVMREIALGKIPNGYTMMTPKMGEFKCQMPGFRMRLGQAIEGSANKIMVFRAENVGNKDAVVDEQYCYKRGVVAISAWPEVVVPPGEMTEIFVMTRMDDSAPATAGRPSLIGRDVVTTEQE